MKIETHRLLNMRERATVRTEHALTFSHDRERYHWAQCACGEIFGPTASVVAISAATREHVDAMMDHAASVKCAVARANAAARADAAIEAALRSGYAAHA